MSVTKKKTKQKVSVTKKKTKPKKIRWHPLGSNQRPPDLKSDVLPAELGRNLVQHMRGLVFHC